MSTGAHQTVGQTEPVTQRATRIGFTDSPSFLLATIGPAIRMALDQRLQDLGLNMRRVGALAHISARPGISYTALAHRAGVSTQSMHETVRALESQSFVERTQATVQGQRASLAITEGGRSALKEALQVAKEFDRHLSSISGLDLARLASELLVVGSGLQSGASPSSE
jgi:DNA-binding MarR family transcriptional regulator